MNIRSQPVFDQTGEHRPANRREEKNECDTDQDIYGFLPRSVLQPVPEIEQSPCAQQQHYRHADGQNTRRFQRRRKPAIQPFLQLRIVTLSMWRESDGFCQPAGKHTGNKCCDTNNRQAAHRCTHHKFQAVARIEQRKEKQHDKIGACQPVPHQRKGADKQAEKGQRMLRKVEQMLGNLFFITKDQVQRPDGHAQHNDDVRQRTYLYIHLIRDNRHGHNQAITYQTA